MGRQEFDVLVESGLLRRVEKIVVESHRKLYLAQGRQWSRPVAYRWLRYESSTPVARLAEGVKSSGGGGLSSTLTLWRKPAWKRRI